MKAKVNNATKKVGKKRLDWREVVVRDLVKAVKHLGLDAKTTSLSFNYPYMCTPSISKRAWCINNDKLWNEIKAKFPNLYSFSVNTNSSIGVGVETDGKLKTYFVPMSIVRKGSRKACKTAIDLMAEDAKNSKVADEALLAKGFKKPTRDIFKDDCCFGCKEACENKAEDIGPFDRRFRCDGLLRIYETLKDSLVVLDDLYLKERQLRERHHDARLPEDTIRRSLLNSQELAIKAIALMNERVANGRLECVDKNRRPECYQETLNV